MTRLNAEASAKLAALSAIHAGYVKDKAELRARIEAEYETRLRDWELKESRGMNEALKAGATKTAIGRAVGLANWEALESKYALTADDFTEAAIAADPILTVDGEFATIHWAEWEGEIIRGDITVPIAYIGHSGVGWITAGHDHDYGIYGDHVVSDYQEDFMRQWFDAVDAIKSEEV